MKRFYFPLQPVVQLRSHQEARAKEALALALQGVSAAVAELEFLHRRTDALAEEMKAARAARFSGVAGVEQAAAYRAQIAECAASERRLVAAQDVATKRRAEYRDARQRLEVVRRLEAKTRAAYAQAVLREEQQELDELASRRHGLHGLPEPA